MKIALSRARSTLSCPLTTCTDGASGYTIKRRNVVTKQLLRVMKLTGFLILATCLHLSANGVGQSITLSVKNTSLKKVFKEIIRQSGTTIIYDDISLKDAKPVTVNVQNATTEEVLSVCLKGQPFSYAWKDGFIIVKSVKPTPTPDLSQGLGDNFSSRLSPSITTPPITGIVRGLDGKPLGSVNIIVKGTTRGTSTAADGSFSLQASQGEWLVITLVGYGTKQIAVGNDGSVGTISLEISDSKLDEVQIVAYGTTTRRFNTGNVASVKAEEIANQPVQNPLLALSGRVPGLQIIQASGLAGGGISVRIQGINSISSGTQPFYVIDGVPFTSNLLPTLNQTLGLSGSAGVYTPSGAGNPLSFINPSDIESIDILKDADATAIYGSRAANGAILITTKKGKAGSTNVDINLKQGIGKMTRRQDILNTSEYLQMRKEAYNNSGEPLPTVASFDNYDLTVWDQNKNTDWQNVMLGGSAEYTDANASVNGGNSNTSFLVSAGFKRETTAFPGDFSDRKGSLHFQMSNTSSNQRFKISLNGQYMLDDNTLPGTDLTNVALYLAPNAPDPINADGSLNWAIAPSGLSSWGFYPGNPLSYLRQPYNNKTRNLLGSAQISYEILPGFVIKSSLGYSTLTADEFWKFPLEGILPEQRSPNSRALLSASGNVSSWIIEPQLTYTRAFGKSRIDVLAGTTFQSDMRRRWNLYSWGFTSDDMMDDISLAAGTSVQSSVRSAYNYNALFARINYSLFDRYIINLSARRDGSSRFGAENLFHDFGALGAAWIFSETSFAKKSLGFLSFGKLRASYGTTGNDQIGDYRYLNLYGSVFAPVAYQNVQGLVPLGLPNPYLQWEETRKMQIGTDLEFFNGRLNFNVTYTRNRSSNQLLSYNLPIATGFSGIASNFPAIIENTGLEITLGGVLVRTKQFSWSANFNVTLPQNKLVAFPGLEKNSYANILVVGQPITISKAFRFAGVNSETGIYQFIARNGELTSTPKGRFQPDNDATVLINVDQRAYGGLSQHFNYRYLSLDILFQFATQKATNTRFGSLPGYFWAISGNQPRAVLDRWQKTGDVASYQQFNLYRTSDYMEPANAATGSDAAYSDASFIRLKNVALTWQIPESVLHRSFLKQARIYAQAQNLLTFTQYDGLDPENRSNSALPPLRMITCGIQFNL
jgi:TonB-dependent starch-binding outer membrane protein SusC